MRQTATSPESTMGLALRQWQTELLDLTRRNRLLNFRPRSGALPLTHPDPGDLFDGLVNRGRTYKFFRPDEAEDNEAQQLALLLADDEASEAPDGASPEDLPARPSRTPGPQEVVADVEPTKVDGLLYKLYLRSRSALVEQGVNVLFAAFGVLDWNEITASESRFLSPLLLVPVALARESAIAPFTLTALDDDVIVNPALARKLELDYRLRLALPDEDDDASLDTRLDLLAGILRAQREWSVRREVHLGLFSFAKYAMYADLATNAERLRQHKLVRAVAGAEDASAEPSIELPSAASLDTCLRPRDTFQVLDADASQQEAIAAVKAGVSLVIQGPPGTGKSQTITNIIAECLAAGKTVLFVSEKITALRVVAKRLAEAGLSEFCLEAHSQQDNKAQVIRALYLALETRLQPPVADDDLPLERIGQLRQRLNAYVQALHDSRNPLGKSAFDVHGELACREGLPWVLFALPEVGALTPARLARLIEAVGRLVQVGGVLLDADRHPWRGATLTSFSPQTQADLREYLDRLYQAAMALDDAQTALRATWGLPADDTFPGARWLRQLLDILDGRVAVPEHWFSSPSLVPVLQLADEHRQRAAMYHERRARSLDHYDERLLALDLETAEPALAAGGGALAEMIRGHIPAADRAIARRAEVDAAIRRACDAFDRLLHAAEAVATRLGLPIPTTGAQVERLARLTEYVLADPRPQPDWFDHHRRQDLDAVAEEAYRHQETVNTGRAALAERFDEELFEFATDDVVQRFEESYGSWARIFKSGYRRDMKQVRRFRRDQDAPLGYEDAVEARRTARRVTKSAGWLADRRDALVAGFGLHYAGLATDWGRVKFSLASIKQIYALLGEEGVSAQLVDLLMGRRGGPSSLQGEAEELRRALAETAQATKNLAAVLALPAQWSTAPIREFRDWLATGRQHLAWFWNAFDAVAACCCDTEPTAAQLLAGIQEARALAALERELLAHGDLLQQTFGPLFHGLETDWQAILEALQWTGQVLTHFGTAPPPGFVATLVAGEPVDRQRRAQLVQALTGADAALERLRPLFDDTAFQAGGQPLSDASLPAIVEWAHERRANLSRLEEWLDYQQALREARTLGLEPFVDELIRVRPPTDQWRAIMLRAVYTSWLTWRYDTAPELAGFRGVAHENLVADFRELDRWQWSAASQRVAARLIERRPVVALNVPPRSEPGILRREAQKRRRFRPLRQLFASIPNLLPALKPCLLMSPLSVAQYLGEAALEFDVVVFDEASQILPADAIGAIGRARQAVIVGDQKQLPPTNFFGAALPAGDDPEGDEELPESILDASLAAGLPQKFLRWHYRSRHEELIAFSNHHFYEDRLITFPTPDATTRAIEFIHIPDGVYDRGSTRVNRVEAARLVDLVVEHVRRAPHQSLGVIAFSEAQADAIQVEVNWRKREDPTLEALLNEEDRDEGFFVKALELVQGDERDVIFFSVGYGPDQAGHMTMNFGPLNRAGGERRLNVAITRARDRIKVLASFQPHDIDRSRTRAVGVHLLRSYLEYAQRGPAAILGEITAEGGDFESPFEATVATALQARGLRVVAQVGVSSFRIDLGIKDEASDRYILGIECDGRTYHSSPTARDRDRLRQQVLERLGWRIHRIWSTDWIKDPEREIAKVLEAVERAKAAIDDPSQPFPNAPPSRTASSAAQEVVLERQAPSASGEPEPPMQICAPYQEEAVGYQGDLETFRYERAAHLATLIERIVDVEGPVHLDRVVHAVAAGYGIARAGSQVRRRILTVVTDMTRSGRIMQRDDFLWPACMDAPPARKHGGRRITEIAPEEIAVVAVGVCGRLFALPRADVITAVAREFGFDRTGNHVAARIGEVLNRLVADGVLADNQGQICLER